MCTFFTSNWIYILSALLTPTIAVAGVVIAFFQWKTNDLKRQNELFDRRYEFYQRLRKWWLATSAPAVNSFDIEDLIPLAEEADFLFGNDISKHILSFEGKSHTGSPFFPNDDFSLPFRKYLKLR